MHDARCYRRHATKEMIGRLPYRRTTAVDRPTCLRRFFAIAASGQRRHTDAVRGTERYHRRGTAARRRPPGGAAPLSGADRGDGSAREGPARLLVLPSLMASADGVDHPEPRVTVREGNCAGVDRDQDRNQGRSAPGFEVRLPLSAHSFLRPSSGLKQRATPRRSWAANSVCRSG